MEYGFNRISNFSGVTSSSGHQIARGCMKEADNQRLL
jgi:hypothetical protein